MDRGMTLPITVGRQPPEWRQKIREAARVMVESLIDRDGAADTTKIREEVVLAARVALGEAESGPLVGSMLENAEAIDGGADFEESSMAGMLRYTLDTFHPGWNTPTQQESIMAEVQGVLEDMLGARRHVPAEWREKIGEAARMLATLEYGMAADAEKSDRAGMLAKVVGHARTALSDAPHDSMFRTTTVRRADGTVGDEELASPAGVIRLVVARFDRTDPAVASSILDVVERSARAELAREVPGDPV